MLNFDSSISIIILESEIISFIYSDKKNYLIASGPRSDFAGLSPPTHVYGHSGGLHSAQFHPKIGNQSSIFFTYFPMQNPHFHDLLFYLRSPQWQNDFNQIIHITCSLSLDRHNICS